MVQVNGNTPINLRVKFLKIGKMQYISHLDLVRTMTKVVIRSKLPVYYTEGFNPIPKLVFAAPLSIGTESLTELMDIRLTERIDPEEAVRLLNENLTDEMRVEEAYYPETKFTDMKWLGYVITLDTNGADEALMKKCISTLLSDEVVIEKKSKKGTMNKVNIRPLIHSVEGYMREGRLIGESRGNRLICLNCTLSADPSSFLNPEHVINVLRAECGILSDPCIINEGYTILRVSAKRADMSEFR